MSKGLWGAIGGAVLVAVLAVVVLVVDASDDDRIADGIRAGTVDVGGLDVAAARWKVAAAIGPSVRRPVTLTYRSRRYVLHPGGIDARLDVAGTVEAARRRGREGNPLSRVLGGSDVQGTVAPRVSYSRAALRAFVGRVARRVDRPARDADIDMRNGRLVRRHASNGVEVRRPELLASLVARLPQPAGDGRSLKVPVTVTERPDRTLADLARRYRTVIGIDRDGKVLRLYEHLRLTRRYRIAVGRQGLESSPGRYKIEEKVVDPPWHAPNRSWAGALAGKTIPAGDPRNPLVARWMGYHDGEGIHGTNDIASLGEQASHGCIRMSPKAVKELYRQVRVGTPVFLQ
jgi:lipoprotein-anchoring transpeptidase ErfK/SrfK